MDSPGYYRVTPKKSPTTESVQRRRKDIEKSEKAAYWALFNTSVALLLYYDLCYLKVLQDVSILLTYIEWLVCVIFTTSACYDFIIHFWPHTFMKPIVINPTEKRLLGVKEEEFGFRIEEPTPVRFEPIFDNLPPFEIHHSFEEDDKECSGTGQYRKEESDKNRVVRRSYGYTDPNGIYRHVDYLTDQNGFRANIKSNDSGLIGETQTGSFQLANSPSRTTSARASANENAEWNALLASISQVDLAPPDFDSSHKSERSYSPRHYRN